MKIPRSGLVAVISVTVSLPLFAGFSSIETYLAAVGRAPGQNGAQFYTTVWATNLTGAPQTLTFQFLRQGQANTNPDSFQDSLAPGETRVYENVIESKLGLNNAIGAARVTSTGEIFVSERIYNQPPGADLGNTEGLFFAGVPKGFSISSGQSASIQGIDQGGSENFRYNFALVETGGGSPTVNVQIFDGTGTMLGQKAYALLPYEQIQPNVADVVAGIKTTNARITATVTGGSGSVILAGAQLANESEDSSGFEMSFRDSLLAGIGTAGVTSLNGLTGALNLISGSGISVTPSGSSISIAFTGGGGSGLTSVTHDASLMGAGTGSSPLAIANGQVVRSLIVGSATLHDSVTLVAGSNVTITPSGSTLTISGGGGLTLPFSGTVTSNDTAFAVTNNGTSVDSNGIQSLSTAGTGVDGRSSSSYGIYGESVSNNAIYTKTNSTDTNNAGVYGYATSGAAGVIGDSPEGHGVAGFSQGTGVNNSAVLAASQGSNGIGLFATNDGTDATVVATNSANGPMLKTFYKGGTLALEVDPAGTTIHGNLSVTGSISAGIKDFVSPDPNNAARQIAYTCLEGPESGTYFRGTGHVVNGLGVIKAPEDFRSVTSPSGITVIATPVGSPAVLTVMKVRLDEIVIQGSADVEFYYMVNGVRAGFENHQTFAPNTTFVPAAATSDMTTVYPTGTIAMLKRNGVLNADGTINLETAHRLGWDQQESWKRAERASR